MLMGLVEDYSRPPVALGIVLVHGIGRQLEGRTLTNFLEAFSEGIEARVVLRRVEPTFAELKVGMAKIHVHEAYWADCLPPARVKGTFSIDELQALPWFPLLNNSAKLYQTPKRRALAFAILASLAIFPIQVALLALSHLPAAQRIMDQVLADVTNYLRSAALVRANRSAKDEPATEIHNRISTVLDRIQKAGCPDVLIVAHSLGSVIAYHLLSRHLVATDAPTSTTPWDGKATVSLVTIGSPLQKISFIWPMLVGRPLFKVRWSNYRDRLDLIAGKLKGNAAWSNVRDIPLIFRGGILLSHTMYFRDPAFIKVVADRISVKTRKRRLLIAIRAAGALQATLLVILPVAVATLGTVLLVLLVVVLAAALSLLWSLQDLSGLASGESVSASNFFAAVATNAQWALGGIRGLSEYTPDETDSSGALFADFVANLLLFGVLVLIIIPIGRGYYYSVRFHNLYRCGIIILPPSHEANTRTPSGPLSTPSNEVRYEGDTEPSSNAEPPTDVGGRQRPIEKHKVIAGCVVVAVLLPAFFYVGRFALYYLGQDLAAVNPISQPLTAAAASTIGACITMLILVILVVLFDLLRSAVPINAKAPIALRWPDEPLVRFARWMNNAQNPGRN